MKNSKYIFVTVLMFFMVMHVTMAQKHLEKGDKYFNRNMFKEAIESYKLELKGSNSKYKDEALRQLANCYRLTGQFALAEETYKKLSKKKKNAQHLLNYALSLKGSSKYAEASEKFKEYIKMNPSDPMGPIYISSCDSAQKWLDESMSNVGYEVKTMDRINTPGIEFATVYYKDGIIFSSSREDSKKPLISFDGGNEVSRLDFYYLPLNASNEQLLIPPQNLGVLNSVMHEGPATFSPDQTEIYFTRTIKGRKVRGQSKILNTLQILYSKKDTNGKWSSPRSAFFFNNLKYSVGHPSLSKDGKKMFFMSDMPGGFGGTDIYCVEKDEDGAWGIPVNLGPKINTFGHELYPFIAADNTLYFSSDVHPGMGKLDVFSAQFSQGAWGSVQNLRPPINTIGDDFAFSISADNSKGFLSSDRFNGKGGEDIYGFIRVQPFHITVNGGLFEFADNSLFDGLTYKLINKETNEESALTSSGGKYSFSIPEGKEYTLSIRKDGFSYSKVDISITRNTEKEYLRVNIFPKQRGLTVDGILKENSKTGDSIEKPVAEALVLLNDSLSKTIESNETGGDGAYIVHKNLFPGNKYQLLSVKGWKKEAPKPVIDSVLVTKADKKRPGRKKELRVILVSGTVKSGNEVLSNVKLKLSDSLGVLKEAYSSADGQYRFFITAGRQHSLTVTATGYMQKDTQITADINAKELKVDIDLALIKTDTIVRMENVYYDYNRAEIQEKSLPSLNKLVDFMLSNPTVVIELGAHTDSRGSDSYNLRLSQARAQTVKNYLVSFKISPARIIAKGYGESKPEIPDALTLKEHQVNRRTEFKILKK